MKNLCLFLASLSFTVQTFADPCGAKSIKVGSNKLELINVIEKPEKTADGLAIKGADEVLVSGIYMFVRNGQTWNTYRCADDAKNLNLKKCVLKNDFEFGNLVKRYGTSGITVRKTDSNRLQVRLNVAGNEELDYYDVRTTEKGMEVIQNQYKENKVQRHLSHHEQVSLGVCSKSESAAPTKKTSSQSKKVNTGN